MQGSVPIIGINKGDLNMDLIYMDNAATTKLKPVVVDRICSMIMRDDYGNPSSLHKAGMKMQTFLTDARKTVADCINAQSSEIYFTSGGTESDNQAILTGAKIGYENGKKHIISQKTEHHAVLRTLERLKDFGFDVELLDVDEKGRVTAEQVKNAIRDDTCLVTIMTANNETGTVQPIEEIGKICRKKGVLFHTDAVQAVGHISVDVKKFNCDMLSMSAHKFGGIIGTGALYVKKGIKPFSLIVGGSQENGARAGTENIVGICAMAAAMRYSVDNIRLGSSVIGRMRDRLAAGLSEIPDTIVNGDIDNRLPNIVNVCFKGVESETLSLFLDGKDVCVSARSACTSNSVEPSHVLKAMGISDEYIRGSVRLSLSELNTDKEIEFVIESIKEAVGYLRKCNEYI